MAAASAASVRAEAERLRLADDADKTEAILGGVQEAAEDKEIVGRSLARRTARCM